MGVVEIAAGPLVAVIGIISVFFVLRHRSVQEKSIYSARRSQIERKVRAARQRTLAPSSKRAEQEAAQAATFAAPGMEAKTAIPTATWGPPAARPDAAQPPPPSQEQQAWEVGPTVPPPPPSMPPPSPPPYTPSAPTYAPPPEEVWTPAPAESFAPAPAESFAPAPAEPMAEPVAPQVSTPAGGGASWSIVGEAKDASEPVPDKKSKKEKDNRGQTGASWQLAAGELPGDESEDLIKKPSAAIAIAQYAVLVVGLVMVLIGVVVMVANSHVT